MWNGIINVNKESGFTSNDVVAKMRGIFHQRKIGHAGTLDPAATGVLPVLLGCATKLSEYMMDHEKTYRMVLLLGVTTDTQDMTGTVLEEKGTGGIDEDAARQAVMSFVGEYDQTPPMYSAKQVNGKRLYELAREGKEIERKSVRVRIKNIVIEEISLPRITCTVECSKGTYIRTLCHDIGRKLGCGSAMESIVRTRVGGFVLEDSITLRRMEELMKAGTMEEKVIPVEEMFLDRLRVRTATSEAEKKLRNGNLLGMEELSLPLMGGGEMIRVCDREGNFAAVYRLDPDRGCYVPRWMLAQDN